MRWSLGLGAILVVVMSGCSGSEEPAAQSQAPIPALKEQLFQAQADALEKAKGVEQTLQQAAAAQRLKIEQQSQ